MMMLTHSMTGQIQILVLKWLMTVCNLICKNSMIITMKPKILVILLRSIQIRKILGNQLILKDLSLLYMETHFMRGQISGKRMMILLREFLKCKKSSLSLMFYKMLLERKVLNKLRKVKKLTIKIMKIFWMKLSNLFKMTQIKMIWKILRLMMTWSV